MRKRIQTTVTGIVQGVGFRPYVYKLAHELELGGFIQNTSKGVMIEIEGETNRLSQFIERMQDNELPLAQIVSIRQEAVPVVNESVFRIQASEHGAERSALISPDIAVCDDCLHEMFDPGDRRFRYPFINCTNCGPRYTIINDIPYDRPKTSMHSFIMCDACQAEYEDPTDRRFHAQPIACPDCGPKLKLCDSNGHVLEIADPIAETIRLIQAGKIIAIKGLGGFHLAVDASNEAAVVRLRERKHREEKPLAVMVRDLNAGRKIARIARREEELLLSYHRPIVLLRKQERIKVAPSIAPKNSYIGVMLPYTPLHYLLLEHERVAWVMTSGNISEEPIAIDNEEAFERLSGIADYFLIHNRDIYLRSDDSVVRIVNTKPRQLRRSRGYIPRPVFLKNQAPSILACGAELKNTICLTKNNQAFVSQHIGDLKNRESLQFFQQTVDHLKRILNIEPEIIVYDFHPNYLNTRYALEQDESINKLGVQHHHAHIAGCMAEHHLDGPVIGLAFDGTGYGTDGHIWGGEVLLVDGPAFERVARLEYVPMPGGDLAIREPWRMALSYLYHAFGDDMLDLPLSLWKYTSDDQRTICISMMKKSVNSPLTSSMGRWFDGIASLLNICQRASYEGQPAIMLEMEITENENIRSYPYELEKIDDHYIVQIVPIMKAVVADVIRQKSVHEISRRFHNTLIELFSQLCIQLGREYDVDRVVMSGGVFQNVNLTVGLTEALQKNSMAVFTHEQVPPNDGGIALGQAWIAAQHKM